MNELKEMLHGFHCARAEMYEAIAAADRKRNDVRTWEAELVKWIANRPQYHHLLKPNLPEVRKLSEKL